jgi:hypothetical protein
VDDIFTDDNTIESLTFGTDFFLVKDKSTGNYSLKISEYNPRFLSSDSFLSAAKFEGNIGTTFRALIAKGSFINLSSMQKILDKGIDYAATILADKFASIIDGYDGKLIISVLRPEKINSGYKIEADVLFPDSKFYDDTAKEDKALSQVNQAINDLNEI